MSIEGDLYKFTTAIFFDLHKQHDVLRTLREPSISSQRGKWIGFKVSDANKQEPEKL